LNISVFRKGKKKANNFGNCKNEIIDKINNSSNGTKQVSNQLLNEIMLREKDPYAAAEETIDNFGGIFLNSHKKN
jgi:hypothetical protein